MKKGLFLLVLLVILTGCGSTTNIEDASNGDIVTIQGDIIEFDDNSMGMMGAWFTIETDQGSTVFVETFDINDDLDIGDSVVVEGRVGINAFDDYDLMDATLIESD